MGGGASKNNHKNSKPDESTSQQDSNSLREQERLKVEAKNSSVEHDEDLEHLPSHQTALPKHSPRGESQLAYGNNHDEDEEYDGVPYSPHSSRDHEEEDEFDYHDDEDQEEGEEDEADNEEAMQLRMLFAQSAMSMDMDNEDLIFNLMYFGGDTANFASMMNNAAEETVAAHSAGNTPYKLAPATEGALQKLKIMTVTEDLISELHLQECSICQEDIEIDNMIAEMPGCSHCFHNECVLKWFTLQSWCPVCRTKILPDETSDDVDADDEECQMNALTKANTHSNTNIIEEGGPVIKSNLSTLFNEASDEREEDVN